MVPDLDCWIAGYCWRGSDGLAPYSIAGSWQALGCTVSTRYQVYEPAVKPKGVTTRRRERESTHPPSSLEMSR